MNDLIDVVREESDADGSLKCAAPPLLLLIYLLISV